MNWCKFVDELEKFLSDWDVIPDTSNSEELKLEIVEKSKMDWFPVYTTDFCYYSIYCRQKISTCIPYKLIWKDLVNVKDFADYIKKRYFKITDESRGVAWEREELKAHLKRYYGISPHDTPMNTLKRSPEWRRWIEQHYLKEDIRVAKKELGVK